MLHSYTNASQRTRLLWIALLFSLTSLPSFSQLLIQLGSGTSTTSATAGSGTAAVYNRYWESRKTQVIYTAAELTAAGFAASADITALALFVVTDINGDLPNFTIKIKHTTASTLTAFDGTGLTTVYTNNLTGTGASIGNWVNFSFSTPFTWNGTDNLLIEFCHGVQTSYNSTGVIRQYAGATNQLRSIISSSFDQCPVTTGGTGGANKPQVLLSVVAPPCSSTPPVLTASATPSTACLGGTTSINLSVNAIFASGITYQWQVDTGSGFNNIAGATTANASVGVPNAASATYRCVVTCTNSGISTNSTTATVSVTGLPTYATLPYSQNFESNWLTSPCLTGSLAGDRPDASWVGTPASGNQSWRRDNTSTTASGWSSTTGGYTPSGANSTSRSARFHTYDAPSGTSGTLDLYIDLSSSTLNKVLSFYYINTSGTDNLAVQISTDGGASFTPLTTSPANPIVVASNWTLVTATITSNSPTTVIRFMATSDYGFSDIGIDEVNILVPPDIEVLGTDNSLIPDGSTTTSPTNGTDFGTISVASTPFVDRTFTIQNSGTEPLDITGVTSSNPNFVIQALPSSPVVSGTTTFTVRFQPNTFGTFTSVISIANNVPTKNPYTFQVSGVATAPIIDVSGLGNSIPNNKTLTMTTDGTFLGVPANASSTLSSTFTISNTGNESLTVSGITFPDGSSFAVSGVPSSVAAGGSADFTVTFNPANGPKIDTLTINNNSANAPVFKFLVSAGGVISALDNPLANGELLISPNPSAGNFNIKIGGTKYTSVKAVVYDVSGRQVKSIDMPQFNGSMDIDLNNVEKGVYFLLLETGGEKVARKLIKQ